ncbi:MAG: hypothetical protein ACXU8O_07660 [Asticcacaulis sp.]
MRHEPSFHAHSIAYEVDADYVDAGQGCTCPMCRPHSSLLSFVSRDNLNVSKGGPNAGHRLAPSHRFNRHRLTHRFTILADSHEPDALPPAYDRLKIRQTRPA